MKLREADEVCLLDMRDVVHKDASYGLGRVTLCERVHVENWYTNASLRWTSKVPTCLLCLGIR